MKFRIGDIIDVGPFSFLVVSMEEDPDNKSIMGLFYDFHAKNNKVVESTWAIGDWGRFTDREVIKNLGQIPQIDLMKMIANARDSQSRNILIKILWRKVR